MIGAGDGRRRGAMDIARSGLLTALAGLVGCGPAAHGTVVAADELAPVEQSALIQGRDGGLSAMLWGQSVWVYGDTVLNVTDALGSNWHHNSWSWTTDTDATDGLSAFADPIEEDGAPGYLIAPTDEELSFNLAHQADTEGSCAESPCGARWAVWPGAPVWDGARERALIPYGKIYAEPGDLNFFGVGESFAVWTGLDEAPIRPDISADPAHPDLLFTEGERAFTLGPTIVDDHLYAFACTLQDLAHRCALGRAPVEAALDRGAWQGWDGAAWTDALDAAKVLFDGAPILDVTWVAGLDAYAAIYSTPFSDAVVMRTAAALTGPWSREVTLFASADGEAMYDAVPHPEFAEDDGLVQYVTYSRSTGEGWFGTEFALWRVELAPQ